MANHILTNLDDTYTTSHSNLGKIEGLRGNDAIIVSGELARQIDGDQGDDDLSGAELIFGGNGDDMIANAQVAYGGDGDDVFATSIATAYGGAGDNTYNMNAGSTAYAGAGHELFFLEQDQSPAGDFAILHDDAATYLANGAQDIIAIDAPIESFVFSRIVEAETGDPTTAVFVEADGLDYGLILTDFFDGPLPDDVRTDYIFVETSSLNDNLQAIYPEGFSVTDTVTLPIGQILAQHEPQSQNDTLHGTEGDDHLEGFYGDDRLFGHGGDDRLEGDQGDDRLFGMSGNDVLFGGAGNNRLDGGSGDDRIHALGNQDEVWGDAGSDVIFAGADETTIWFEEIGDDAEVSETDTIHKFDLGQDKIMIEDQEFDASSAAAFLAGSAELQGEDLFLDLGDGRGIKLLGIVDEDDPDAETTDFIEIFEI